MSHAKHSKDATSLEATQPSGNLGTPSIDPHTGEILDAPQHQPPFVRSPYNYDMFAASGETSLYCPEPTLTQQQFRDEVDINTIVRNFGLTGELPENGAYPAYSDFAEIIDYHTAMNVIRAADEAFMALPAEARARFANDPQRLMEFVADKNNAAEAAKLGLTRTLLAPYTPPTPAAPAPVGIQAPAPLVAPASGPTNT